MSLREGPPAPGVVALAKGVPDALALVGDVRGVAPLVKELCPKNPIDFSLHGLVRSRIVSARTKRTGQPIGTSSSGRTTDSGSVSGSSILSVPAKCTHIRPVRLAVQDAALSRRRSPVRIWYGLPDTPGVGQRAGSFPFAARPRRRRERPTPPHKGRGGGLVSWCGFTQHSSEGSACTEKLRIGFLSAEFDLVKRRSSP